MNTLNTLLKDSAYKLTQFSLVQIEALEKRIIDKDMRGKLTPHVVCLVRGKEIKLTPEEVVRQLYLMVLIDDLGYPVSRINIEYGVTFGRETKRADICIFDKDRPTTPYILVELKKPKLKDGKEQLKSYCNATGAPIGVWSNGDSISFYQRKDPNYFEDIPRIPSALEKLSDVLSERWTIDDLIKYDKLVNEKKSLKDLILEMEDEVLANAGVDVFEELFKLVFTKLYDEMEGWRDKKRHLEFRNYGDTETELKAKIQNLFDKARGKWEGVFTEDSKLQLTPSHLAVCIASLESVKLFNSNLDVVDEAFEYLINKSSKGEKGQYFTPRYVIDMCVKMLNPQEYETLIDTAAGSCGFPVHGIFHVWEQILKEEGLQKSHLFTAEAKPARCTDYVVNKVFAIDFDEKAVRVGRTLNLIAGDGQTNVLHLNTLDYERWDEKTKDESWTDIYGEGWKKLRKLRATKDENRDFGFDILMANPPFAGDIKETRILAKYELARSVSLEKIKTVTEGDKNIQDISHRNPSFSEFLHVSHETIYKMADGTYRKVKIKEQSNVGRDILFIERNLNFLKSGGRMAVVLPQGRFNNSSDKNIREYIAEHCRILAVVGLHGNVFKPHTGTKTSVLLVQKWDEQLCPKVDDYPIFFATMQEPSKDNSGDKIYVAQADGSPLLDSHEHLIVKHDLFNHDGLTQDGIAEAFVEFAKKEKLSFFDSSPFDEVSYRALLEGLEISEISYSTIDLENRYDSEYFQKKYLVAEKFLKSKPNFQMGERYKVTDGEHGSVVIQDSGIKYLTAENIKKGYVDISNIRYVNEIVDRKNARARVQTGDILISIKGTLGEVAVAEEWLLPANMNRDVAILKPLSDSCQSEFLAVFLMSKYGAIQSLRVGSGGVQQMITLERLREFCIPILSDNFCIIICDLYKKSQRLFSESKTLYSQAENLLLDALGMADFSPSNENINIKSFKDSFFTTGRLDAEYYQPKYEEMITSIKKLPCKNLDDFIESYSTGYPYKSDDYLENAGIPLIRINNIKKGFLDLSNTAYLPIEQKEISKNDIAIEGDILLSMSGTIGNSCVIPENVTALINQRIMRFTPKDYNPTVLMLILNSIVGAYQLERVGTGGVQTNISSNDINKIVIPILPDETQTKIAELVQQSFVLKAESETLLDLAKRAVEMAIEEDEAVAMGYLENGK